MFHKLSKKETSPTETPEPLSSNVSESFLQKYYVAICIFVFLASILLIIFSEEIHTTCTVEHDLFSLLGFECLGKSILHEVGFAGIVAVFLVYTIETLNSKRHQIAAERLLDEINTDLFRAVYKRFIPTPVFTEFERCVMRSNVYRTSYELDYSIDLFDERDENVSSDLRNEYFKCTAQTSYVLTSTTDHESKHTIKVNIELPIDTSLHSFCKIQEIKIDDVPITIEDLRLCDKSTPIQVVFQKEINISPKQEIRISSKSILVKKKTDTEIWSSWIPSDGLQLTVSTPNPSIIVHAVANHSQSLRKEIDYPLRHKWRLGYGIIPHQSIVFWWHPKPDSNAV